MFLKLWQYSQENTCVGVSFLIKLQAFSIPPENIKKPLDFLMLSGGIDKGLQSTLTFSGKVIVSWQVLTFKPPDLSLSSFLLDMTSDSSFLRFLRKTTCFIQTLHRITIKYCPLIWMFHERRANHKINRLHEPIMIKCHIFGIY